MHTQTYTHTNTQLLIKYTKIHIIHLTTHSQYYKINRHILLDAWHTF